MPRTLFTADEGLLGNLTGLAGSGRGPAQNRSKVKMHPAAQTEMSCGLVRRPMLVSAGWTSYSEPGYVLVGWSLRCPRSFGG